MILVVPLAGSSHININYNTCLTLSGNIHIKTLLRFTSYNCIGLFLSVSHHLVKHSVMQSAGEVYLFFNYMSHCLSLW